MLNAIWRKVQILWSVLAPGDVAKATDIVCSVTLSTVRDVLRQAVPSMFFSVTVGYVTLVLSLVSCFPLRRWTQSALNDLPFFLCAKSDAFKFFFSKCTLSFYKLSAFERCYYTGILTLPTD